mmetsp:Transcript_9777/g.18908  ORF Transcript_9777/g.18908 Transcript_9777/m.18908 type:complete len:143 (+) Transcript_9777:77-505(+)
MMVLRAALVIGLLGVSPQAVYYAQKEESWEADARALQTHHKREDCDIKEDMGAQEALKRIRTCTEALQAQLQATANGRVQSTEANAAYAKQFQKVMDLLKRLQDDKAMMQAFTEGHEKARSTLIAEVTKIEEDIDTLSQSSS